MYTHTFYVASTAGTESGCQTTNTSCDTIQGAFTYATSYTSSPFSITLLSGTHTKEQNTVAVGSYTLELTSQHPKNTTLQVSFLFDTQSPFFTVSTGRLSVLSVSISFEKNLTQPFIVATSSTSAEQRGRVNITQVVFKSGWSIVMETALLTLQNTDFICKSTSFDGFTTTSHPLISTLQYSTLSFTNTTAQSVTRRSGSGSVLSLTGTPFDNSLTLSGLSCTECECLSIGGGGALSLTLSAPQCVNLSSLSLLHSLLCIL